MTTVSLRILALLLPLAVPATALATTYCCTTADGKRVCGDIKPPECLSRAYREFGNQGLVVKQYEAPLTPEQKAVRDAELARKLAEERRVAEEERRTRALLASYPSVKDIDQKRDRMLVEAENQLKSTQTRYDNAVARRAELTKELEFYTKKPVPSALQAQLRDSDTEIADLQTAIEARKKDIADVVERYEDEKRRYQAAIEKRAAGHNAR